MKILGNRLLVSKVEEPKKEGFETVDVMDSFVYKGKIEQLGEDRYSSEGVTMTTTYPLQVDALEVGKTILFAKYSPDTQEIEHEGVKYKIVEVRDILAVL